jgi:hypothetical protein
MASKFYDMHYMIQNKFVLPKMTRGISPSQGRYLHTEQTHTDIHALSGIRTHDPSA